MTSKPYTFDRVVRMLIGLAVLVSIFLIIQRLSGVLLPFLAAWLVAYLLQPLVRFFQYKLRLRSRILSVVCTLTLVFSVITAVLLFLIPLVVGEFVKLSEIIMVNARNVEVDALLPVSVQTQIADYLKKMDLQSVMNNDSMMDAIRKLTAQLWAFVNGSVDLLIRMMVFVVGLLYLIFILIDFETIGTGWIQIIPPKYRGLVMNIALDLEEGMNRYFRGQALIALLVGILFAVGFSIIGLPLAIVMGLLIGLLTMVPYLKAVLVLPCISLGWLQSLETGQSFAGILLGIAVVFVVIQIIEDLFMVPKIMGRVTGLNPAVILLSLSIWGALMGVVGMIIALPMTTLVLSYYKRFVLGEFTKDADSTDSESNKAVADSTPDNLSVEM